MYNELTMSNKRGAVHTSRGFPYAYTMMFGKAGNALLEQ